MTVQSSPVDGGRPDVPPRPLSASPLPLVEVHDAALLDLDGVVYRGSGAVPHAAEAIAHARGKGMRAVFVTNNALRPPTAVARRLTDFGVPADQADVVTSAQAAARVLATRLPRGAAVLVAGGAGLREAVTEVGLRPVTTCQERPAAVVQGFDPDITYRRLAEAALAIRAGALWVASNIDATVPGERGLMPGNGSLVAMLRTATGSEPLVAGKPEWAMHEESVHRSGARCPLIVGDRLDTDIEAAVRAGVPSLLVLTGVTSPSELLRAPASQRPTYVAPDLRGLLARHPGARVEGQDGPAVPATRWASDGGLREVDLLDSGVTAVCGGWTAHGREGTLTWTKAGAHRASGGSASFTQEALDRAVPGDAEDDGLDALRAACAAAWELADAGVPVRTVAGERPPGCGDLC